MREIINELKTVKAVHLILAFAGMYGLCWLAHTAMLLLGVA